MKNLADFTIKSFHDGLLNREFSALEITQEFFKHISVRDKEVGAYLTLLERDATIQAERVDIMVARDEAVPPLAGVPFAIKDNMLIEGVRTTAASKMLESYIASYDATVVKKLKKEGVVILGKTNLDEFAMGSSTENSAYQLTHNPHDLGRVPGGSSGGSVAAVASHMAVAALGSDTGGSIRQPASLCGVVGFKPTYGAVSRFGLIALASSLDQIGPITKTVEDAALVFKVIAGKDPYDSTSVDRPVGAFEMGLSKNNLEEVRKLTIGIPKEYFIAGLDNLVARGVEEAIKKLKNLKFEIKEVSLPHTKYALSCYYIILPAEVSTNLARFDGVRYASVAAAEGHIKNLRETYFKNRGLGFGVETRRRILLGTFVLSAGYYDAYYAKAQKVRRLIKNDFDEAFKEVDVILAPTSPTPAFKLGDKVLDPLSMYLSDILTIPVNLAGLPAISIPVKKYPLQDKELPIGFQLIGKHFHESDILNIGQLYEGLE
ncbi:Asp-tRNA(Asn)/Glu-tRNA(Gln) amidotransferase subunit GatA [Candidatus Jorgensenbacteria bacterium]|nr:Asp-tRNA(Asn)/Glu-tRNA(Gln) amidotransferase subunit GatA [Candidatus Jorgensenbacteria bacterium]